jgi:putative oxidoreductase
MAFIFVYSGWGKLFGYHDMAVTGFQQMGFPAPAFWVWFVGIVELVGGLMVGLGIFARYASVPLAITMIVAMCTAHWGGPINGYFLPLALLGGCAAIMGVGAGKYRLVKTECHCATCKDGAMASPGCGCGGNCSCGMAKEEKK